MKITSAHKRKVEKLYQKVECLEYLMITQIHQNMGFYPNIEEITAYVNDLVPELPASEKEESIEFIFDESENAREEQNNKLCQPVEGKPND